MSTGQCLHTKQYQSENSTFVSPQVARRQDRIGDLQDELRVKCEEVETCRRDIQTLERSVGDREEDQRALSDEVRPAAGISCPCLSDRSVQRPPSLM